MDLTGRPNILFVTAEDICPNLGCYGDPNAITPNLDRFASEGIRFTNVFSVHPCCSPSRSCLATGVYPTRLGTFQHRARMWVSNDEVRCITAILRENGYYTFNGMQGGAYKTDYNFEPQDSPWDSIRSKEIAWRKRASGQPFLGQVNLFRTHQSQYGWRRVGEPDPHRTHDPAAIRLPPYHPDTPATREIWAEYHDRMTEMDEQFSHILRLLENDGLDEDTIVIFLGDNGMGIPAGKIWIWEQGLHVPMIIRLPEKWQHLCSGTPGHVDRRMVSFLDFASTVLALCDLPIPDYMQGQIALGPDAVERQYCFAARDFHDGADFDTSRAVRGNRFHYVRNFMPHQGWDPILYSWSRAPHMLTEWLQAAETGKLDHNMRQCAFFATEKPVEELYDVLVDPDCMHNLAEASEHQATLCEMRKHCKTWMIENGDLGLISQYELYSRSETVLTPYRLSTDRKENPIEDLIEVAELANRPTENNIDDLKRLLNHEDGTLRRWAAIGLLAAGPIAEAARGVLSAALGDDAPDVRLTAAEALCQMGDTEKAIDTIRSLLSFPDGIIRREALYVLVRIGEAARPLLPNLDEALQPSPHSDIWSNDNVVEAVTLLRACLGEPCEKDDSMIPYALTRRRNRRTTTGHHIAIIPGLTIAVSVLSINLLGDALRDTLDPHLRGRG